MVHGPWSDGRAVNGYHITCMHQVCTKPAESASDATKSNTNANPRHSFIFTLAFINFHRVSQLVGYLPPSSSHSLLRPSVPAIAIIGIISHVTGLSMLWFRAHHPV